ncbi:Mtap [Trypoxylus dichotomus]
MNKIKIGIIGGTGFDNPDILKERKEIEMTTRFGPPSDSVVVEGKISGVLCVLVSRHGKDHSITPSKVNYRANIWALKELGCTHIIASTATGSLKEEIKPGDIVIPDDFIDRTYKRTQSFYDGDADSLQGVFHLPMHPPFCEPLRKLIINTAKEIDIDCHDGGTVVTIEGPRFSSKSESKMFQMFGCALVNMSTVPEVMLAKEAGILYAAIAMATDYDCWKEDYDNVSHASVQETFKQNVDKVLKLITTIIPKIAEKNWDNDILEAKELIESSMM